MSGAKLLVQCSATEQLVWKLALQHNHTQLKNRLSAVTRSERSAHWRLVFSLPIKSREWHPQINLSCTSDHQLQLPSSPVLHYQTVLQREFILICKQPMSLLEFLVHSTVFPLLPLFYFRSADVCTDRENFIPFFL